MRAVAIAGAGVLASLVLGLESAFAAGEGPTVDRFPVTFVLSSATCSNLPSGATTIFGSGTETSTTTVRADQSGTTIANTTVTLGRANDQLGRRYQFLYRNHFTVSDTVAAPGIFSGQMTDSFQLQGDGQAMSNAFLARFTTDFYSFFTFDPIFAFGDPIDFATGAAHCDPL